MIRRDQPKTPNPCRKFPHHEKEEDSENFPHFLSDQCTRFEEEKSVEEFEASGGRTVVG
jgi:hypothetical protein